MTEPAPGDPHDVSSAVAEHLRALERHVVSLGGDPLDPSLVSPARRYDQLQGGKDNFEVDRRSASYLQKALPNIRLAAAELRRCMQRQVGYLAGCGIRQFLDIGCGLPHHPNVHDIAQAVDPTARIVYVDSDKVVGVHARALLIGTPEGDTRFVPGDLTDIDTILHDKTVREVLDFDQPIGVLLLAVLHFIVDDQQAYPAVDRIKASLAPGSHLALTHVTFDPLEPDKAVYLTDLAESLDHGPFKARTRVETAAFLEGLELVAPGLVSTVEWRADRGQPSRVTVDEAMAYAAIGRLP